MYYQVRWGVGASVARQTPEALSRVTLKSGSYGFRFNVPAAKLLTWARGFRCIPIVLRHNDALSLSLSIQTDMYTYMYAYMYPCICIYIYIYMYFYAYVGACCVEG